MNILTQINQRANSFDDIFDIKYQEKETKFDQDPLALSVALKELVEQNIGEYYSLNDDRVLAHVSDQHRERAEEIRKYFAKKFFWNNLSGNRSLSDFRQRVCYLLENRISVCKEKDCGIYYKLPYFYEEDMVYEEFKRQYQTVDVPRINHGITRTKSTIQLRYLKSTASRQSKRNVVRFWFTDETYLYCVDIVKDNPLLELFKQLVLDRLTVSLETYYNVDRLDQLEFYRLYNFSLAKETNA